MKKICEKLFQPFVTVDLFWILFSILDPFKTYNEANIFWHILGIILLIITVLLTYYMLHSDKNN